MSLGSNSTLWSAHWAQTLKLHLWFIEAIEGHDKDSAFSDMSIGNFEIFDYDIK